jgi:hypothetical protein
MNRCFVCGKQTDNDLPGVKRCNSCRDKIEKGIPSKCDVCGEMKPTEFIHFETNWSKEPPEEKLKCRDCNYAWLKAKGYNVDESIKEDEEHKKRMQRVAEITARLDGITAMCTDENKNNTELKEQIYKEAEQILKELEKM